MKVSDTLLSEVIHQLMIDANFTLTDLRRMKFSFTRTARRHKIGKAHARAALADAGEAIVDPSGDLRWIGLDDRGLELEIVGFVAKEDPDLVIIKHVMPVEFKRK